MCVLSNQNGTSVGHVRYLTYKSNSTCICKLHCKKCAHTHTHTHTHRHLPQTRQPNSAVCSPVTSDRIRWPLSSLEKSIVNLESPNTKRQHREGGCVWDVCESCVCEVCVGRS